VKAYGGWRRVTAVCVFVLLAAAQPLGIDGLPDRAERPGAAAFGLAAAAGCFVSLRLAPPVADGPTRAARAEAVLRSAAVGALAALAVVLAAQLVAG